MIIPLLLTGIICYRVDVFNTLHPLDVRMNGNEINKNYVKMTYVLNNPNKFDTFIFGSSRIGNIHVEKITNERCYNMYYGKGVPRENLNNIKTLIKNNYNVKKIYLGVDSYSYTEDYSVHNEEPLRSNYEYLRKHPIKFIEMYYDLSLAIRTLKEQYINGENDDYGTNEIFYKYGWNHDYGENVEFDFSNAEALIGGSYLLDETLQDIRELKILCDENDIELIVFTNPMYYVTYEASLDVDYYEFLKKLADITPYYNFSGYNSITTNSDNYYETSHYKAETSDLLIDIIWNHKKYDDLINEGFGLYVTQDNVDYLLNLLQDNRTKYLSSK